jgi:hypothetical protein
MYTSAGIESVIIYLVVVHALVHFVAEVSHVYRFCRRRFVSAGSAQRGRARAMVALLVVVGVAGCVASAPAVFYGLEAIQHAR